MFLKAALLGIHTNILARVGRFRKTNVRTQKLRDMAANCKKVYPAALTCAKTGSDTATATRLKIAAVFTSKSLALTNKCNKESPFRGCTSEQSTPLGVLGGKESSMRLAISTWPKAKACQKTECPDASIISGSHAPRPTKCLTNCASPTCTARQSSALPAKRKAACDSARRGSVPIACAVSGPCASAAASASRAGVTSDTGSSLSTTVSASSSLTSCDPPTSSA
mmetsp:Transcript_1863/g.5226  ORF Transcript_1863/g.5226 Transcript_1863/m.5226 type:complete len:224 (+) Transcript_1863:1225-1896(+)